MYESFMPLKNFSKNFNLADKIRTKENIAIPQRPAMSPKLRANKDKLANLYCKGNTKSHSNNGTNDKIVRMYHPELRKNLYNI
jgi:hypothetical protein